MNPRDCFKASLFSLRRAQKICQFKFLFSSKFDLELSPVRFLSSVGVRAAKHLGLPPNRLGHGATASITHLATLTTKTYLHGRFHFKRDGRWSDSATARLIPLRYVRRALSGHRGARYYHQSQVSLSNLNISCYETPSRSPAHTQEDAR